MWKRAEKTALAAQRRLSTSRDVCLCLFVDGSFESKAEPSGVSVIFRRFRPGTADHGKLVEMKFHIRDSSGLDNNVVEGIAILQGVEVAICELEEAGDVEATAFKVLILTDSKSNLDFIRKGVLSKERDTHHAATNFVFSEITAATHRLNGCRGKPSSLELHWVKAHTNHVDFHTKADERANDARVLVSATRCEALVEGVVPVPCPANVFDRLEDELSDVAAITIVRGEHSTLPFRPFTRAAAPSPEPGR